MLHVGDFGEFAPESAATGGFRAESSDLDFLVEFRTPLAYAEIDDRLVWDIVENKLPVLRREVDELLAND